MRYRHGAVLGVIALTGFVATQLAVPASAATAPLKDAREIAHFDVTAQQQPENIALEPGGAVDVTFTRARQVARVGLDGSVTVLATLPAPATGTTAIDDLAFFGAGDTVLAAQNYVSQVSIVRPDGAHRTVLTATGGLSNPTSVARPCMWRAGRIPPVSIRTCCS